MNDLDLCLEVVSRSCQPIVRTFHCQSPGLVQLTVHHHWRVGATSWVGAECCSQADHWNTTMWPHLTGASPAALASSAHQLQDRHTCSSVSVPSYLADDCRLVTDRWCQTIAFCRHSNTGRRSHTKFFWRQNIRCGSTSALEQFVVWCKTTWLGWLPHSPVVIFGVHLKHFFVGSRATDKLRPQLRCVRYFSDNLYVITYTVQGGPKMAQLLNALTLSNINRFSKFILSLSESGENL